jgi:SAM-dependent methyltransferase
MDWRIKAVVQAILSKVPMGERVNDLLQLTLGGHKRSGLSHSIGGQLSELARMQAALCEANFELQGKDVLEVGTGWDPIYAVYLSLLGAQVTTFDVVRHLKPGSYVKLLLANFLEKVSNQGDLDKERRALLDSFLQRKIDWETLLQTLNITYVAPVRDSYLLELPASSFDMVFSMAVLEHAKPKDIEVILLGQKHILRPGGLAYHDIGLGDHCTSIDSSITFANFLKYDGWLWKYLGENRLAYHNRLRYSDFMHLFEVHDAKVIWSESFVDEKAKALISQGQLRVISRFAGYELDDLATKRLRVLLSLHAI